MDPESIGGMGNDFLSQMLGGIANALGKSAPPQAPTALAASIAVGIATGGQGEPNVDPSVRMAAEKVAQVADLLVADLTTFHRPSHGTPVEVVTPGTWAERTAKDWGYLLEAANRPDEASTGSPAAGGQPAAQAHDDSAAIVADPPGLTGGGAGGKKSAPSPSGIPATTDAADPGREGTASPDGMAGYAVENSTVKDGSDGSESLTAEEAAIFEHIASRLNAGTTPVTDSSSEVPSAMGDPPSVIAGETAGILESLFPSGSLFSPGPVPPVGSSGEAASPFDFDLNRISAQWMQMVGPALSAMQFGTTVGSLAGWDLGQYGLPVPRVTSGAQTKVMLVGPNIQRFAAEWSLDLDEACLWVAVRELLLHAVLSLPHVSGRLRGLLEEIASQAVSNIAITIPMLGEALSRGDFSGFDNLEDFLADPSQLVGGEAPAAQAQTRAKLGALAAAISGYVNHVMQKAAPRLLGGRTSVAEAWFRYHSADPEDKGWAAWSLGLDIDGPTEERGASFVSGVIERGGEDLIELMWKSDVTLPTLAELEAPGLWIERMKIEGLV